MREILSAGALMLAATMLSGCGETVDSGQIGVLAERGKVSPTPLPEGYHMVNPFFDDVIMINARSSRYDQTTISYTRDLQKATVKYAVQWQPIAAQIPRLFQQVGTDFDNQIIPPVVISAIKNELGKFTAPEAVAKRAALEAEIQKNVQPILRAKGIELLTLSLLDISFEAEYENANERKVVAIQNAEAEVNRTVQVRERGRQIVIAAEADADSIRVKSQALENNPRYVDLLRVQKWNGAYPSTVYCTSSTPCVGQ